MCCSAWPASFSNTITGTWEVSVDGRVNHVLWYQNRVGGSNGGNSQVFNVRQAVNEVEKRTGKPFPQPVPAELIEGSGNCLIIPLMGKWESIRLLNTLNTANLLKDISTALEPPPSRSLSKSFASFGAPSGGMIFMQFDIYDIVLAERAEDIPAVLDQIQQSKRPKVNPYMFEFFGSWYGCPVALCCFNSIDAGTAKPLGFAFEPLNPESLVVYTLDGHDGYVPNPSAMVKMDHTIFVGSYLMNADQYAHVAYSDEIPDDLKPYLLDKVLGMSVYETFENGDLTFSTSAVREGKFHGLRSLPPRAPSGTHRIGHNIWRSDAYRSSQEKAFIIDEIVI